MLFRVTTLALCCAALAACSPQNQTAQPTAASPAAASAAASQTVTVQTARGEATVPLNPERIAVYDLGMIDTLHKLGVPIGAAVDQSRLDYVQAAIADAQKVGTLFEPNYEALHAYQPQLIIIGSRGAKAFDELS